jgi:FAD:protein FMN transferase
VRAGRGVRQVSRPGRRDRGATGPGDRADARAVRGGVPAPVGGQPGSATRPPAVAPRRRAPVSCCGRRHRTGNEPGRGQSRADDGARNHPAGSGTDHSAADNAAQPQAHAGAHDHEPVQAGRLDRMTTGTAASGRAPILAVRPPAPDLVGRVFTVFGTLGSLFVTRAAALRPAYRSIATVLAEVDLACSRFRPDSELTAINQAGGRPVRISQLLVQAMTAALRAAEVTDGDVDPTCGRSLARLGYDRDFGQLASAGGTADVTPEPAGGWRRVELDTARGVLRVPPGVHLDLGATAKALAADMSAAAVAREHDTGALVNLGGDIAVAGPPPASGWPVGIAAGPHDRHGRDYGPVVAIWDGGLATSGPLARSWHRGSRQLHHILVPGTGQPAESVWSAVTVAAASCVDANTASTAAIVRSAAAPDWLHGLGLPARLIRPDGSVVTTGGWPE